MLSQKKFLYFALALVALLLGFSALFFFFDQGLYALPKNDFWKTFAVNEKIENTPWLGKYAVDEWSFSSTDGKGLKVHRHIGEPSAMEYLFKDWLIRTKSLQAMAIDPYFPGITKDQDCQDAYKIKILQEEPRQMALFSMGAGKNMVAGACSGTNVEYKMFRKLYQCPSRKSSKNNVLWILDLFIPNGQADAVKEVNALDCGTFSPE